MTEARAEARIDIRAGGGIGTLTLHNPRKRNAMTLDMWTDLPGKVRYLATDRGIKVVVVRGEGDTFSAGADITEFRQRRFTVEDHLSYNHAVAEGLDALAAAEKPVIGMLRGSCFGGGALIATACALRFADTTLRFAITASKLGAVYSPGEIARLVALIGPSATFDMLATSRTVPAEEAVTLGLIDRLVAPDALEGTVDDYARELATRAPLTIASIRTAIRGTIPALAPDLLARLREIEVQVAESADYREGVAAFLEKRDPTFEGR